MSFFYYVGDTARHARAHRYGRNIIPRFGQGPSRTFTAAMAARLLSVAAQAIQQFDRFLHVTVERLAASKLRRIERELQLRGVQYRHGENEARLSDFRR